MERNIQNLQFSIVDKFNSLLGKISKAMYTRLQLILKLRKFQNTQENIEILLSALQF